MVSLAGLRSDAASVGLVDASATPEAGFVAASSGAAAGAAEKTRAVISFWTSRRFPMARNVLSARVAGLRTLGSRRGSTVGDRSDA